MTGIHVKQRIDEAFNEIEKAVESGNMSFEDLKSNTISMDRLMKLAAYVGVLDEKDLLRYRVMVKALIQKFIDHRYEECEAVHNERKDVDSLHEYMRNCEESRQGFFKDFHFRLAAFRCAKRAQLSGCETIRGHKLSEVSDGLNRRLWIMINDAYVNGVISKSEQVRLSCQVSQVREMGLIRHA